MKTSNNKVAKSLMAMVKLSILKADLGAEYKVDWTEDYQKYCIFKFYDNITLSVNVATQHFLAFNTYSIAERFLNKHINLINEYFEGLT